MQLTPKRVLAGMLALNAAVAGLFLWLSSRQWVEPQLRGVPDVNEGGRTVFSVTVLELAIPILALNVAWLVYAMKSNAARPDRMAAMFLFVLVGLVWCWLLYFSASRI